MKKGLDDDDDEGGRWIHCVVMTESELKRCFEGQNDYWYRKDSFSFLLFLCDNLKLKFDLRRNSRLLKDKEKMKISHKELTVIMWNWKETIEMVWIGWLPERNLKKSQGHFKYFSNCQMM